jgi:hypothetical protein
MMSDVFLEVILDVAEASASGITSRDEIEDPLEEALAASGVGEVTGGGGGMGRYIIDLEMALDTFDTGLGIVRKVLQQRKVPASTRIKRNEPNEIEYVVYQ